MQINEQIREKRKNIGLTQEQVANYPGVSTPAVNKWERGNTYPDISLLHKRDVNQSLKQIRDLFEAAQIPWNMSASPLYYRIAQNSFTDIGNHFVPAFIAELENSKEYDFLRTNKEFKKLLADYHEATNI